jgi:hypothetical protein
MPPPGLPALTWAPGRFGELIPLGVAIRAATREPQRRGVCSESRTGGSGRPEEHSHLTATRTAEFGPTQVTRRGPRP